MMIEDVHSFGARARAWLAANFALLPPGADPFLPTGRSETDWVTQARALQRRLFDAGFAGLCFPEEYGGQGLTAEHQAAFSAESAPYVMPLLFNVPSLGIIAPTILDYGTEDQKRRHVPAILRGDELWVQFLSEPTGGSDLAGVITQAERDGDEWIMNGSKVWSSNAYRSDYALCLARTAWDLPKHRGLTMFMVKVHQPGIQIERIKQVNGATHFCQEFFTDVRIPAADVLGEVNQGWDVATHLLVHERGAVGGGSPYVSGLRASESRLPPCDLAELARRTGQAGDSRVRQLVAEGHLLGVVQQQLIERVTKGMASGALPAPAASLLRLFDATNHVRQTDIRMEIAGTAAVTSPPGDSDGDLGVAFIFRQGMCLGGGSNEMQRNLISERLLGMPRERDDSVARPFREVRRNSMPGRPG